MELQKIADYAWLGKGRKYWTLWLGNPFCVTRYRPSIEIPKERIIKDIIMAQKKEKKRFTKRFKDTKWEG